MIPLREVLKDRIVRIALAASFILHVCAAYFSVGYNWFDEYFQIIEFAGYKLGKTPTSSLPWEFHERVRPWLEPWICYCIARVESLFGIHSPSAWLFSFQLAGALLGWISLLVLIACAGRWIRDRKHLRYTVISLCIFWFFPWFHARTSSENWASSVFFIGAFFWITRENRKLKGAALDLLAGSLWGLAFFFRNQVAAMIIGGGLWLLKEKKLRFLPAALGFFIAMGFGTYLDHWGYGAWTISWWRYLDTCVFHHVAASFGATPWWDYFRLMWIQAPPFLGAAVIAMAFATWILLPNSFVTWVCVPFLLLHMGLAHKELRYLYPIAPLVPLFPALVLEALPVSALKAPRAKRILATLMIFFAVLNTPFLLFGTFSAEKNSFRLIQYVSARFSGDFDLYSAVPDPFEDIKTLHFLRPVGYRFHPITEAAELNRAIESSPSGIYFFNNKTEPPSGFSTALARCKPRFLTFGPFFKHVDFNGWLERAANWQLFLCKKKG